MRCTDALNESSFNATRASREILAKGAEIMEAWMHVLEDDDREDAENVDEDFKIEVEELEHDHK